MTTTVPTGPGEASVQAEITFPRSSRLQVVDLAVLSTPTGDIPKLLDTMPDPHVPPMDSVAPTEALVRFAVDLLVLKRVAGTRRGKVARRPDVFDMVGHARPSTPPPPTEVT